jgi:hypothetical protein
MKNMTRSVFAAAGLVLLTGCEDDNKIPYLDNMEEVWAEMFAPYGLFPLFPVRTDFQPGDVVISCKKRSPIAASSASAASNAASGPAASVVRKSEWIRLFSLHKVGPALLEYQQSRLNYHSFATPSGASASAPLGAASGVKPFSPATNPQRVGFASFPSILSYNQKRSDVGVGGAVGVVAVGAGRSSASQGFYTLEIPSAEYVGAPHSVLQHALLETAPLKQHEAATLISTARAIEAKNCDGESLSVVGDVYYTRKLTVSMGDSYAAAGSARAAYQLPVDSTRNAVYKAIGSYATGASAPAAPSSSPLPQQQADLAKLLIDIDAIYKNADSNSKLDFPGLKVGFAKSGGKGISLDYEFAVPVAFGVRLFPLKLAKNDEDVVLNPILPVISSLDIKDLDNTMPLGGTVPGSAGSASAPR